MNKQVHRLVFDRNRGMRVPAAEHVRSAGKAGGGQTRAVAVACALTLAGMVDASVAATRSLNTTVPRSATVWANRTNPGASLPVRSTAVGRIAGDRGRFVISNPDATNLLVEQSDKSIVINWDSFNIGRGYGVHFEQPKDGTALNKIWDLNPTVILGKLTATGQVILENTNGVIFGPTARVETQRFVATALASAKNTRDDQLNTDDNGRTAAFGGDDANPYGFVSVERGAEIKALAGGHVMLIGPKVYNEGRIETPDGQTVLAAGQKVYLFNSQDANQHGFLVAVDSFASGPEGVNTVENAQAQQPKNDDGTDDLSQQINAIVAERGTINLVGLTVRQNGLLTATSAVADGKGGIYLHAQKATKFDETTQRRVVTELGTVELGATGQTRALQSQEQLDRLTDPTANLTELGNQLSATQAELQDLQQQKVALEENLRGLLEQAAQAEPPAELPSQIADAKSQLAVITLGVGKKQADLDVAQTRVTDQRAVVSQIGNHLNQSLVVDIQAKNIVNGRQTGAATGGEVLWANYQIDRPDWLNPTASALFRAISVQDGTNVLIQQTQDRAIFTWDSFDIGQGMSVAFEQPLKASVLNRVEGVSPSTIAGKLKANSELIVENQAGLTFESSAQVEAGRFVATGLRVDDAAFNKGLRKDIGSGVVFGGDSASSSSFVHIQQGATITARAVEGQASDVLIVGPQVTNAGTITTPDGQTVLAAGQKVFLSASIDQSARGLNVLTDGFEQPPGSQLDLPVGTNTVVNEGTVKAERGTITLVGEAIRQNGQLLATTAVKGKNGYISLHASKKSYNANTEVPRELDQLGSIEFGVNSVTAITPEYDNGAGAKQATQKDSDKFYRSRIDVIGKEVRVRADGAQGAKIIAKAGDINLLALAGTGKSTSNNSPIVGPAIGDIVADDSHLVVDSGALIDASGERDVAVAMDRNQQSGRLFKIELADSPVQRGGVLYRSTVSFDASKAIGIADVSGFYNDIERDAKELSTRGGNVRMESQGAVVVSKGATVDISGGSIKYQDGVVSTSFLRQGQRLVRLSDAKAGQRYDELINSTGTTVQLGYVEGFDAGTLTVAGMKRTATDLSGLKAGVVVGPKQRNGRSLKLSEAERELFKKKFGVEPESFENLIENDKKATPVVPQARPTHVEVASLLKLYPHLYGSVKPQAGLVTVGKIFGDDAQSQLLNQVNVVQTRTAAVGNVPMGAAAMADFINALQASTEVVIDELKSSSLGRLTLNGNQVAVSQGASLNLGSGGELAINANDRITVAGSVKAEGGKFTAKLKKAGDFLLKSGAMVDLSGRQLDELGTPGGTDALSVDGGIFEVKAGHSAVLAAGSQVDVSAGVWRAGSGTLTKGSAGKVDVGANTSEEPFVENGQLKTGQVVLDGTLSAFDFNKGGTLSVKGMRTLAIGGEAFNGGLALTPEFFSASGFGAFDLSALGDVRVADNTQLTPVLSNLVMGTGRGGMTGKAVLDPGARQSTKLALTASLQPYTPDRLPYEGLDDGSSLTIGTNALVDVGAGGQMTLKAGRNLVVDGRLQAHGGAVSLSLLGERGGSDAQASLDKVGYLADQVILLKAGSVIDVSGTTKANSVNGRMMGEVLGGGTVNLNYAPEKTAVRGRVVTEGASETEAASEINVSGAADDLNLNAGSRKTRISKGAGAINVGSTDGFLLQGTMTASRPDASVAGGQFYASISRAGAGSAVVSTGVNYPEQNDPSIKRELIVEATNDQLAQHAQNGYAKGVVSAAQLASAGFDRIQLRADDRIVLGEGASLGAAEGQQRLRTLVLNTPVLQALGSGKAGEHTLQASHVSLGDRDLKPPFGSSEASKPQASTGDATLAVNAGLIELSGHSALQGVKETTLAATLGAADHQPGSRTDGEIRFIGRPFDVTTSKLEGSLNFAGDLNLQAGQIYATTLSDFKVTGLPDQSKLTVSALQGGSTSRTPLSALAKLTLDAHDVLIKGVIRQPFGLITIKGATTPVLSADSVLSVTGDGVTVPVGTMLNGSKWVYGTQGTQDNDNAVPDTTVKQLDGLTMAKGITISGNSLSIDGQSQLLAQAGGDLLATEFVAGAGGSTDTLKRANVFAVLPNYSYDFAPFDTEINANTKVNGVSLTAGDQFSVTTDNGVLAKGIYTLLPAQYAVLPGAVLVSEATLPAGVNLTKASIQDDGSVLVMGHKTAVGTTINGGQDPRLALLLEPEATFRAKSELQNTSINGLLASQAKKQGTAMPSRPGDAGRVSLEATGAAFDWAAQYNLAGAEGFAGGQFDLAMTDAMALIKQGDAKPEGFSATVTADALKATGAESILLGGIRTTNDDGDTVIQTKSSKVLLGADLSIGELLAVAKDQVEVADKVSLTSTVASSDQAAPLVVQGGGAALVVSNRIDTDLQRDLSAGDATAPLGLLKIGQDVKLAGQAVQLDASQQVSADASLLIDAKSLGLGSQRIAIGGASDHADALVVDSALLDNKERLQLRSYSSIDMVGSVALGKTATDGTPTLKKLTLDAPVIRGVGQAGDAVTVVAQQVTLRNGSKLAPSSAPTDSKTTLSILAKPPVKDATAEGITLGGGQQHLAFASTQLTTTGDVVARDNGKLTTQADVTIKSARLTAGTGVDQAIESQAGVLTIAQAPVANDQARTLNDRVGAGAKLSLTGQRVLQQGTIDLASGQINITGKGQDGQLETVVFAEGSKTLAKGWVASAGSTWSTAAPGGKISALADKGNIVLNGLLDVSAPSGAAAGAVNLTAAKGQLVVGSAANLQGGSTSQGTSGIVTVDAGNLVRNSGETTAVANANQALDDLIKLSQKGGFQREVEVRVREGNLSLNETMAATRVVMSADKGSLTLNETAKIDAHAERGGVVQLSARDDVILKKGNLGAAQIVADSSPDAAVGANGGDILLASTQGKVILASGVTVSAKGDDAEDGRVVIRAKRDSATTFGADRVQLDADDVVAGEVVIEAVQTYSGEKLASGTSVAATKTIGQETLKTDTKNFMAKKANVLNALGLTASKVQLRAGVELQSDGDFQVANDWNLWEATRAGGEPITLTIRAKGDLSINGSLSDGFATATRAADNATAPTEIKSGDAASFRLVAGADTKGANVLATNGPATTGSLTIAGGKIVRTTSGSIDLAAGNDVVLGAGTGPTPVQGVAYVAGRPSAKPANLAMAASGLPKWGQFTEHGGRLSVAAGRDIVSPLAKQWIGNWFYHTGKDASSVTWWSAFDGFKQGLGSMGGGDVRVTAGGDISNLGVVAPTSARTVRNTVGGASALSQLTQNGGDVLVRADGDISGGIYFLGKGRGRIESGGTVDKGGAQKESDLGLVLGLMDGQWAVQAGGDVNLALVYNPTMLDSTAPRATASADSGAYLTYGDTAAVSLLSVHGDVVWAANSVTSKEAIEEFHGNSSIPVQERLALASRASVVRDTLNLAPGTMSLSALSGDVGIEWSGNLYLAPSAVGDLSIYAGEDVRLGTQASKRLGLLDTDVTNWNAWTVSKPALKASAQIILEGNLASGMLDDGKSAPKMLHEADSQPASVHANGDLLFQSSTSLVIAKPADISAGGDIENISYVGQNFKNADITRIVAGGNVNGVVNVDPTRPNGKIQLGGPGELQIEAGHDINLFNAYGIETIGNLTNPALSNQSASIRVAAGMDKKVDVDEFAAQYLNTDSAAQAALVTFVQKQMQVSGLTYTQALAYYRDMTPANQNKFADDQLLPKFLATYITPKSSSLVADYAAYKQAQLQANDIAQTFVPSSAAEEAALIAFVKQKLVSHGWSEAEVNDLNADQALRRYRGETLAGHRPMNSADRLEFVTDQVLLPRFVATTLSTDPAKVVNILSEHMGSQPGLALGEFVSWAWSGDAGVRDAVLGFVESKGAVGKVGQAQALDVFRQMPLADQQQFATGQGLAPFMSAYLQSSTYAQAWSAAAAQAGVAGTGNEFTSARFRQFKDDVMMKEIQRLGSNVTSVALSSNAIENAQRLATRQVVWDLMNNTIGLTGLGAGFDFTGDINLAGSKVQTQGPGDKSSGGIDLFAPGGQVLVGLTKATAFDRQQGATRGLIAAQGGGIRSFSDGDFQVNSQKLFVVGTGDVMLYSANGDIDSGRGSNTDVAAIDVQVGQDSFFGDTVYTVKPPVTGSGIGIVRNGQGEADGRVSLLTPNGEVRALDAFIQGPGKIEIPGPVLGADNLKGAVVGQAAAPVVTVNLSVNTGLGTETAAGEAVSAEATQRGKTKERSSLLTVELLGMGDQEGAGAAPAEKVCPDDKEKKSGKDNLNCVK
ncbi:filamentous hemagglutinin N-terminal domain-containing protein [Aquabacterium sp.]|uniref:two-partner secretion domain-containing protein n=1 Tax=Aquabacterium sp. TaxID=1872578 RepID=UPI002488012D|nr:filamentous hemagglutinin N-terminal domain-containing protein [Aquabacterium sp.]MDI1257888.1 filamentous hemagglutinin N-terminal domain-containing protein [Aquabacterium sp.]